MCEILSGTPIEMFPYSSHVSMPYTEAQWIPNNVSYIPSSEYDSAAYTAPANPNAQRRHPNVEASSVTPNALDGRHKPGSASYTNNEDDMPQYQQNEQSRVPRYEPNMNAYNYQNATNLPLSPPASSTPYLGQDIGQMAGSTSPSSRADPVPIAPNLAGVHPRQPLSQTREEEELTVISDTRKRKRTASTPEHPPELTEEEKLLLKLKEDENLPWKDIAMRFQQELGKTYQVPALQMRFKRLRERIRQWTDNDIQALEQAFEHWEKHQFEIIATKMLDFGCPERFPAKAVQRKWEELHADKFTIAQQPFSFGHPNSAPTYANGAFGGPGGLFAAQQHGFFRNLSVGAPGAPGVSPFTSPGPHGPYVFGQQPTATSLLSPAPGSVAGSTTASTYGTSPLLPGGGTGIQPTISTGGIGPASTKFASLPGPYIRSSSIPTPRSSGGSPGPFTAPDDAAMAIPGATTVSEVGGGNMGLGLGLNMSPSSNHQHQHHHQQQVQEIHHHHQHQQYRAGHALQGRQRSFSSMQ